MNRFMDSRELRDFDAEELAEIHEVGERILELKMEQAELEKSEEVAQYQKLENQRKAAAATLRGLIMKRSPLGGRKFELDGWMIVATQARETYEINDDMIDDDVVADYGDVDVMGRPLFRLTINPKYLQEAIALGLVDKEDLIERGVVRITSTTPSIQVREGKFK